MDLAASAQRSDMIGWRSTSLPGGNSELLIGLTFDSTITTTSKDGIAVNRNEKIADMKDIISQIHQLAVTSA